MSHPYSGGWFARASRRLASLAGRPATFCIALGLIVAWGLSGPLFGYSDTWQLLVNTTTTIITFLMVFLIQNTQNRDTTAMQIKLDELIRSTQGAHNALLDLEELDEDQLAEYLKRYEELAAKARERLESGQLATGSPDIKLP
jgi:low affinity Fe/Cu permease